VVGFVVGQQALKDARFSVEYCEGKLTDPWRSSVGYLLNLSEFAGDRRFIRPIPASAKEGEPNPWGEFVIKAPIRSKGPTLTIAVTPKKARSNYRYDFHVTVAGRSDQHFSLRNGQPITRADVRLADLNGGSFLDIMTVGGTDDRGEDWYKTLIYDEDKEEYRWLTD
jgi:hypothetical protein